MFIAITIIIKHGYGKLPIYKWFLMIYLLTIVICHSYVKGPEGTMIYSYYIHGANL